jgi:hypothetical protein
MLLHSPLSPYIGTVNVSPPGIGNLKVMLPLNGPRYTLTAVTLITAPLMIGPSLSGGTIVCERLISSLSDLPASLTTATVGTK